MKVTPVEKNPSYYEPYKGQDGAWLGEHEGGMGWALDTWEWPGWRLGHQHYIFFTLERSNLIQGKIIDRSNLVLYLYIERSNL